MGNSFYHPNEMQQLYLINGKSMICNDRIQTDTHSQQGRGGKWEQGLGNMSEKAQ